MSLFSFIKNAGEKIFGSSSENKKKEAAAEAENAAEAIAEANKKAAARIEETITDLGLKVENLKVVINGETATITGLAKDQPTKEKAVLLTGNVEGISEVDDLLEVKETGPQAQFYTVVSGDSLSKIAKKYYGNAMKYPVIFEANKPMLSDPDKIYPGQVLRIPEL